MKKILLLSFVLSSCSTIPKQEPKQEPKLPELCVTVVDPHLCLLKIDNDDFAAHGKNKCEAVKKLAKELEKAGHNPLIVKKATCGRVYH